MVLIGALQKYKVSDAIEAALSPTTDPYGAGKRKALVFQIIAISHLS
jgi:hypothetical protein